LYSYPAATPFPAASDPPDPPVAPPPDSGGIVATVVLLAAVAFAFAKTMFALNLLLLLL